MTLRLIFRGHRVVLDLLFLTQRIPYPPTKGEKIRSYRMLRHLSSRYRVHLGCLVDDPDDERHVPTVEAMCATSHLARIDRRLAKVGCLTGLLTGEGLSVTFYRDSGLDSWVYRTLQSVRPQVVFVLSSNMAPYVMGRLGGERLSICDFVDVDSEKWRAYGALDRGPMGWIHRREHRKVAALEVAAARGFDFGILVTEVEADLLRRMVPDAADRIRAVPNGVDAAFFDPSLPFPAPYPTDRPNVVFTGTMDYPPNVEAVRWFAADVLPLLRRTHPDVAFHVVGSNPAPAVRALAADPAVFVTGRVADVRPYLAHASVAVAPMRIARGIQNKVLEAMSMGLPVVLTSGALEGIDAVPGREAFLADDAVAFAGRCATAIGDRGREVGRAARAKVVSEFGWDARLRGLDLLLDEDGRDRKRTF